MDVDPAKRPDANQLADELEVLLEPETKRARRKAVLALVLPLLAVAIGAVGAFGYIGLKEVVAQRRAAASAAAHAQTLEAELGTTRAERSMVDTRLSRAESQLEQGRLSQSELEETVEVVRASLDAMRDRAQDAERARAAETNRRIAAEAERDRALARAWNAAQSLIQRGEELDRTRAQAQTLRAARGLAHARREPCARGPRRPHACSPRARTPAHAPRKERLDAARLRIQQLERRQQ